MHNNLKQNIDGHNKSTLQKKIVPSKACNCRKPADCPLAGNCLKQSVVYQATVATEDNRPDQTYVGLTENSFKTRFTNHKASFNHLSKKLNTELSKHIWNLLLTLEYDRACFTFRHLMLYKLLLSFRLQTYLLNSVACLYRSFLNEHTWFLYLNLTDV